MITKNNISWESAKNLLKLGLCDYVMFVDGKSNCYYLDEAAPNGISMWYKQTKFHRISKINP